MLFALEIGRIEAGVAAQCIKPLPVMLALKWVFIGVPAVHLPIQCLANVPRKVEDDPEYSVLPPMQEPQVLGPWLHLGQGLGHCGHLRSKLVDGGFSFLFFLSL